jgi:hypothetical protein
MATAPLTEDELRKFVDDWYELLDVHAPVDKVLPLLVDEGLELVFPEVTEHGHAGFKNWYEKVTNRFFDEVHTLKELNVTPGEKGLIQLVVNWQCRIWDPPDAKSKWLGFDATQSWDMVRSPETGKPQILRYSVDKFIPMPGSSPL